MSDKEFVVIALVIIGTYSLYVMGTGAESIISNIIAGLCGIAVGKSLNGRKNE